MMPGDDVLTEPTARRIKVFTRAGRRRRWTLDDKARILAESYSTSVGEVADRYGLSKPQVFTWRRDARTKLPALAEPVFAAVIVEPPAPESPGPASPKSPRCKSRRGDDGGIELEIGGVVMRVARGAEVKALAAIIRALKADR